MGRVLAAETEMRIALNHFETIDVLSVSTTQPPRPTTVAQSSPAESFFGPLAVYSPFVISGLLFVTALVILTAGKFRRARITFGMLVVALFAAAIPAMLTAINSGVNVPTQAAPGETPRNVRISYPQEGTAVIEWDTEKEQIGMVRYGRTLTDPASVSLAGSPVERSTHHVATLTNLEKDQKYEVQVFSGRQWYSAPDSPIVILLE